MRQVLLRSTLGLLVAALLLFAVPLGIAVRGLLVDRALDQLQAELQQVAAFVEQRARTCGEVQLWLTAAAQGGADVTLFGRGGEVLFAAGRARPAPPDDAVVAAWAGRPGRALVDGRLSAAVTLSSGVCGRQLLVRATAPDDDLTGSVRRAWLAIAGVGAAVLVLAFAATRLQGRRLAAPFEELARSAARLGDGDFTARAPRTGLPEADAIAEALDTTADRLGRTVQRGAAFTADASHQLRTPLTALRLHLETLAAGGADPGAVEAALAEAGRLEATVDELVELTRLDAATRHVDLGALVSERAEVWRARAAALGRELHVERLPVPRLPVRAAAVGQALEVLLDNAMEHGRGRVTIRIAPTLPAGDEPQDGGPDGRGGIRICVLDEGPGIEPERALQPGSRDRGAAAPVQGGRGLVLARSLVEGEGGRLLLERTDAGGTRACLVLPAPHPPAARQGAGQGA